MMKNQKNNQKLLLITLFLGLIILLNGCSLAKKEAGNDTSDTLIGAFITDSYLDLFDIDTYLNDNASKLFQNSDTVINESAEYTNPLYAKIDRQNHRDAAYWEISFDDISGLSLLAPFWTDENDAVCYSTRSSNGICDINSDVHATDNGNDTTLSGTIYTLPKSTDKDIAYFVNPVYQTSDGKIYAVPGSSISASDVLDEGAVMSTSISSQTDTTETGQTKTEKSSVTIRFASMFEPVKITLIQMDKENKIVKQEEFTPGKLPEEMTAEKETAYILIKTEKKSPDGNIVIARNIYEPQDSDSEESLETFYAMDNGIVSKQHTVITWKK